MSDQTPTAESSRRGPQPRDPDSADADDPDEDGPPQSGPGLVDDPTRWGYSTDAIRRPDEERDDRHVHSDRGDGPGGAAPGAAPRPRRSPRGATHAAPYYTGMVEHESRGKAGVQNVTLTLPSDLLREARHLAVDRGVSLSRYLALVLEERVEAARRYEQARARHQRLLDEGLALGTGGTVAWTRDELHAR